jgi:TFIIF-interacting CTD phosphatase-like protein
VARIATRHAKLLVLDLDETLIHARGRGETELPWPPQRQVAHYRLYLRPGVREFMTAVLERFVAVGIWTSATRDYATAMLDRIVDRRRLRFLYARNRCVQRHGAELGESYWHKDVRELDGFGFDLEQILVVDDKPRSFEGSYENLIRVRPFEGDPEDRELAKLLHFLDELAPCADVREVDKRSWWTRFEAERG